MPLTPTLPLPKAILWDMDGTLIDQTAAIIRAYGDVIQSMGGGIPDPLPSQVGASDSMPKTVLAKDSPGVVAGGVCLDGTPPAYYLGKSTTGSTTW